MSCKHTGLNGFCDLCEEERYQRFRIRFMKELGIAMLDANWGAVRGSFQPTSPEPFLGAHELTPEMEARFIDLKVHLKPFKATDFCTCQGITMGSDPQCPIHGT